MTPKEKAKELVDKYYIFNHIGNRHAVKCALIAVEEIMADVIINSESDDVGKRLDYWAEVKQEIEKL